MFWIVDSILMQKSKKNATGGTRGIHYHRSSARYDRLKYNVESYSDSDSSGNEVVHFPSKTGQASRARRLASPVTRDSERLDSTEL